MEGEDMYGNEDMYGEEGEGHMVSKGEVFLFFRSESHRNPSTLKLIHSSLIFHHSTNSVKLGETCWKQ